MPFGTKAKDNPVDLPEAPPEETAQAVDNTVDEPKVTRQYNKTPEVPGHLLTATDVVRPEENLALRTRVRSADQQIVDTDVKDTYSWWLADGKPAANMARRKQYNVPPELVTPTRKMLEKAGNFLKIHVDIATGEASAYGEIPVQFAARDKQERKPRSNAA